MNYIVQIRPNTADPERCERLLHVNFRATQRFTALASVDGRVEELHPDEILGVEGLLGVVPEIHRLGGVVMRLDKREVLLRRFIKRIEFVHNGAQFRGNVIALGDTSVFWYNDKVTTVNMVDKVLEVHGVDCSIFVRRDVFGMREVYSLYDTLCWICRQSGVNIMRSHTIELFSNCLNDDVVIELEHTKEAERFYAKMWLDVNKDVVRI